MARSGGVKWMVSMGILGATLSGAVSDRSAEAAFVSAPAVVAIGVSSGSLDETTRIFGYTSIPAGGVHIINNDGCSPSHWRDTFADLFAGGGASGWAGWDGDPAAISSDGSVDRFWICGHDSGAGRGIYCQRGQMVMNCTTLPHFSNSPDANAVRVGTKTFPTGSSPALVRIQSIFGAWMALLYARGDDNQIWSSVHFDTGNWGIWVQLPILPGGFDSSPAVAAYSAGRVIVCARQASNSVYACAHQEFNAVGSLYWGNWIEVPGFPGVGTKPALATNDTTIFLFGVGIAGPQNVLVSSLPIGGGTWSSNAVVGPGGYGFLSGLAAVAIFSGAHAGPSVLTVARGGDSAFWWDGGSSSGWNYYWNQLPF